MSYKSTFLEKQLPFQMIVYSPIFVLLESSLHILKAQSILYNLLTYTAMIQ